ncbi:hypothetical protein Q31b_57710 [Novipirellula aureliae]|uniref:Protein NO VEIN C-terminal domain-containing protein n=1 Tax=Novipirellula aureliae TaxID=2527966 RepID=A0A5C6DC71_9BACT|nr:DUF3883 domain-containing protein [Novipirellula aureliae]TWU33454.1 hypothetical protein Q31b_57710 [Novipirellula aureliae]
MSNSQIEYWLFNTDETEPEGEGKHAIMLQQQVVAAWGHCKGLGAEVTLNRPNPGDIVFYFRARFGIIAMAVATDQFAVPGKSVFGEHGEYSRPVENLQVLSEAKPVSVAEIKSNTSYQIPFRQIMGRILNDSAVEYLKGRFQRIRSKPPRPHKKPETKPGAFVQMDSEVRKEVERTAVRVVTKIYRKAKWHVKSVERENVGYDLRCTKGDLLDCVEVKGTSGVDERFIITVNELNKAKTDPQFVLYIVTNVLKKPVPHKYSGKQLINKFDIQPIQFRASRKR